MTEVKFYEDIEEERLKFAVILSKTQDKYVFCRHRERDTWEVPGGHREAGETILETAKRELHSEIEEIVITSNLPERWTYPNIQPELMREAGKGDICENGKKCNNFMLFLTSLIACAFCNHILQYS